MRSQQSSKLKRVLGVSVLAVVVALLVLQRGSQSAGAVTATSGSIVAATPPAITGLHVSGNEILNGAGQAVLLHGVNRSGSEYMCLGGGGIVFDGPFDATSVQAIASWDPNAVRVQLNEDCWLGINGEPSSMTASAYQTAIGNFVTLLNNNGMAVILDLQWNAPGTTVANAQVPMPDRDHSPAFWSSVATFFKGDTSVLFDLFNEPYPDNNNDSTAGWTCWLNGGTCPGVSYQAAGMQEMLNAVRATGAANIVMAGGLQYSNTLDQWLTYEPMDPAGNLAASWHDYLGQICDNSACFNSTILPVAAKVPVITGELGETDCATSFVTPQMTLLDSSNISYLGWAWDTYDCSSFPALITNYTGTPTVFGQAFHDHFIALATGSTPAPAVIAISPSTGAGTGGTLVTITGSNFLTSTGGATVQFGANPGTSFTCVSATSCTALSPAGTAGATVDVTVTTASGTSTTSSADHFTYLTPPTVTGVSPNQGPAGGGTVVTVTGTGFSTTAGQTSIKFGANAGTSVNCSSGTSYAVFSPPSSTPTVQTTVDVVVTAPGGFSATSPADRFSYAPAPAVTSISPAGGPPAGGTAVTIIGTTFTTMPAATTVKFGANSATNVSCSSTTTCTATSPAGTAGTTVDVTVITLAGTSPTSLTDQFSYGAPAVTSINPLIGPATGGTAVAITGTGFTGVSAIRFGPNAATSVSCASATTCTATSPAGTAGATVDVTATAAAGTSAAVSADQFTYNLGSSLAAITLRGATSNTNNTGATTLSLSIPTGVAAQDVLLAQVVVEGGSGINVTSPAGWTQIRRDDSAAATGGSGFPAMSAVLYDHVATASEPATYSWTFSASEEASGGIADYAGVNTATPIDASSGQPNNDTGSSATMTAPSVTTTFANDTLIFFGAYDAYLSWTPPPGMTQRWDITSSQYTGAYMADQALTAAGPTGTVTAMGPYNGFTNVSALVALAPALPVPSVTGISPAGGPPAGGTSVTVIGAGFNTAAGQTVISFGSSMAGNVTCSSATTCTAVSPSGTGVVDVRVTTAGGTSATTALDEYSYGPLALGDVNGDGHVTSVDALCVLRIVAGLPGTATCPVPPPGNPIIANGETQGGTPTSVDALCILRGVVGLPATSTCPLITLSAAGATNTTEQTVSNAQRSSP